MRLASFNLENLFSRVKALNLENSAERKKILTAYSRLNDRIQKPTYTAADKTAILNDLEILGLLRSDESEFAFLRQNRKGFLKRPQNGPTQVVATGRDSWVGWVELKKEAVSVVATRMTAQVIRDVNADVLAVIEAEDRIALLRFNQQLLKPVNSEYNCVMLIDGNDDRGIDVGLMTKSNIDIGAIISHVDDSIDGDRIFSRDCPEYSLEVNGQKLLILINHLKSKIGNPTDSNARRKAQATRVREVYDKRRQEGVDLIAIVGDFNDTPDSDPLSPLLGNGSDLRDISEHDTFEPDGRVGTFGNGTASQKFDYILLSPGLFANVTKGKYWRMGVWGGVNGTLFPHYPEMENQAHAASDHVAVIAEIDI
jgi:endonuclease/exonuclease/phosphatase family metal-dependent hydrolase